MYKNLLDKRITRLSALITSTLNIVRKWQLGTKEIEEHLSA